MWAWRRVCGSAASSAPTPGRASGPAEGPAGSAPTRRWRQRHARGQAILEFALIGWVLVAVAMAILDFGLLFYSYEAITNGAREGARYAIGSPTNTTGIETAAKDQLVMLDPSRVTVGVATSGSTNWGRPITVTVTYNYLPVTPLATTLLGNGYQITAKSSMRIE